MKYITLFWATLDLVWLIAIHALIVLAIWNQAWLEGVFWALMLIIMKLPTRK